MQPLVDRLDDALTTLGGTPTIKLGRVTSSMQVKLDGDATAIPFDVIDVGSPLVEGERVVCALQNRRVFILARPDHPTPYARRKTPQNALNLAANVWQGYTAVFVYSAGPAVLRIDARCTAYAMGGGSVKLGIRLNSLDGEYLAPDAPEGGGSPDQSLISHTPGFGVPLTVTRTITKPADELFLIDLVVARNNTAASFVEDCAIEVTGLSGNPILT